MKPDATGQDAVELRCQALAWLAKQTNKCLSAIIEGKAAVIPVFEYADGKNYLTSTALLDPCADNYRLDRP